MHYTDYPPTVNDIARLLNEVVEEVGEDYIYPSSHRKNKGEENPHGTCQYVYEGKADCIAARVLHKYGVPVEVLGSYEGSSAHFVMLSIWEDTSDEAAWGLTEAQVQQDHDAAWGKARDFAVARMKDGVLGL